ncbi:MAG: cysteine dioxygenase type [Solirubrobacterales bacterium]|nr:cysteine dioxygenase type [Solirubrobacterales bacterium]
MSSTSSAGVRGPGSPTVSQLSGVSSGRHRPPTFSAVPRPRGRDLSAPELETFVAELADRPELWVHLVQHDSTQRHYEELLRDEHLTAWLICWLEDHDTGFHDHDVSSGAVAVVSGAVREERLVIEGPSRDRTLCAGETFHFSPSDIHRVTHAGSGPAVSLHVYSPPLLRMGAYVIGEDGLLGRRPMSDLEELRQLERPPAS